MGPRPSYRAAGAKAYTRAAETAKIDLRLDANEGPLSLLGRCGFDRVPEAILRDAIRMYPDVGALEDVLCGRLGVDRSRLVVTAGGDDALSRICQSVLEPGCEAVATTPTFEMIPRYVRLSGATLKESAWLDGPLPVAAMSSQMSERTRAVFVVTPNNPTGGVATAHDLQVLAERAPEALLVVDLAYTEFADEDLSDAALRLPNTIIVRTMSKAWGLAGLRIGYAVGPATVISWLRAVGQPYAVAGPSAALAAWAITNIADQMLAGVAQVKHERAVLTDLLRSRGAQVLDSQANFVLARFPDDAAAASGLAQRGIAIRRFADRPGLEGWIRITCPGDEQLLARLIACLKEIA